MMWHWFGWGFPGWGGLLMLVAMIVFWGLIIWLIVTLVRQARVHRFMHDHPHIESAMEILKTRYAKGEISKEEFEEKKKDLM